MDAALVIPEDAKWPDERKLHRAVMTMRHPIVERAIKVSFWYDNKPWQEPYILPVRPDLAPGRIGQQSSCFTLHMHNAKDVDNSTMISIRVPADKKQGILGELHRVNVNQFTAFYNLDSLSKEVKRGWGLKEKTC